MIRVLCHRLPRFCMGRRGTARVRTRSPPQQQQQYKRSYSSIKTDEELISSTSEFSSKNSTEMNYKLQDNNSSGNRVMIVVDSSLEAKGALHWALSHTVQSQLDTIILMHVLVTNNSSTQGGINSSREVNQRAYELLSSTKNICQMKRPGVQVEILVKEGQEKGATIVEEAKQEKVSLLVLGQPKRSIMWRLRNMWAGKRKRRRGSGAVDYCVQNANCMTIAVRRKSSKHGGGYLITTKRHKDFWLLA